MVILSSKPTGSRTPRSFLARLALSNDKGPRESGQIPCALFPFAAMLPMSALGLRDSNASARRPGCRHLRPRGQQVSADDPRPPESGRHTASRRLWNSSQNA
jgi:hypothetical protein